MTIDKLQNLGIVATSTFLGLTLTNLAPAQAASFTFDFGSGLASAEGYLSFTNSPLRGVGRETISLYELYPFNEGDVGFDYEYKIYDTIFDGSNDITIVPWTGNPLFYFDSGELVGIDLDTETVGLSSGDCRSFPCVLFGGTVRVEVRRNMSQEFRSGTLLYVEDPFTSTTTEINNAIYNKGMIDFQTIDPVDPVESIPEPSLTLLYIGTALGFGTFFKRKLGHK